MKNFFKICIVLLVVSDNMYSQNWLCVKPQNINSVSVYTSNATATSIEKSTLNNSIRIYSNPAMRMITISCDSGIKSGCTLIIKNTLGQLVYLDPIKETSGPFIREVDLGFQPTGAYLVEVESNYERTSKTVILH